MSHCIGAGDVVRDKQTGTRADVLEVACGGARVRYDYGGPYGERGRLYSVWEHLIDLVLVYRVNHDAGDEDRR